MKLNVGCGTNKMDGYINLDYNPQVNPDVRRDIERGLPWNDETFDEINCEQVLEHIHDIVFVMSEFWRVLRKGGKLRISVPLVTGKWAFIDPTHIRYFVPESFNFWLHPDYNSKNAGVGCEYKLIKKEIIEHSVYIELEK
jgi:predicted SAM-dependent methyltransferase